MKPTPNELDDDDRLITNEEVGRRLGLHPQTVLRMVRNGQLFPPIKLGRATYRWRVADLNAFIAEQVKRAAEEAQKPARRRRG
jgi:excisionase family DNA binding protein